MCGIIALLRRPAAVQPIDLTPLVGQLTNAADRLAGDGETPNWKMLGEAIEAAGYNPVVVMIVTNPGPYAEVIPVATGDIRQGQTALDLVG